MSLAKKQLGADLAPLLARSIVKVREQKRSERIWSDDELAAAHQAVDDELWRVAFNEADRC